MSKHTTELWYADVRAGCVGIYPESQKDYANGLHPTDHGRDMVLFQMGDDKASTTNGYPEVSNKLADRVRRIAHDHNAMSGIASAEPGSVAKLVQELQNIANAKPETWEDPADFTAWAQSRACYTLGLAAIAVEGGG